MSVQPRVSILIPVHNGADRLPGCIASIESQSLQDFEVLAVDDGSTDASAPILEGWAAKDPRVRLLKPGRIGLVASLNLGLTASRGELVARMDADDRMAPDRLRRQIRFLDRHPAVTLVGSRVRITGETAPRAGYREYVRWQNRLLDTESIAAEIFVECPIAHPSFMFRRTSVLRVGGYRDGNFPEDYELLLRLWSRGHRLAKVADVLVDWFDHPRRTSRTDSRYARSAFDRLRAGYLANDHRVRSSRRRAIWGAGRSRSRTRLVHSRGIDFEAWIDIDPVKIGRRLWGRPIHPPEWLLDNRVDLILVYVTRHGAREQIGAFLDRSGYRNGRDYLFVG